MWFMTAYVEPRGTVIGIVNADEQAIAEEVFMNKLEKEYPGYDIEILDSCKLDIKAEPIFLCEI